MINKTTYELSLFFGIFTLTVLLGCIVTLWFLPIKEILYVAMGAGMLSLLFWVVVLLYMSVGGENET